MPQINDSRGWTVTTVPNSVQQLHLDIAKGKARMIKEDDPWPNTFDDSEWVMARLSQEYKIGEK